MDASPVIDTVEAAAGEAVPFFVVTQDQVEIVRYAATLTRNGHPYSYLDLDREAEYKICWIVFMSRTWTYYRRLFVGTPLY